MPNLAFPVSAKALKEKLGITKQVVYRIFASMNSSVLPMLITGLPGIPGYNSFHYFRKKLGTEVIGLKPSHTRELQYPGVFGIDAEDEKGIATLFKKYAFRTVIDASGCCALKSCEYNPALADTLNTRFGILLNKHCLDYGSQLIRFSTDLVFDGAGTGNYIETSPLSPLTVYGRSMAAAEEGILSANPMAAIFRIPLPMGPSLNGHAGAVDWIENRFKKNNVATLYFDEVRSNIYIQDVIKTLGFWLNNFTPGIFHLGGTLPLSLYDVAQIINRVGLYPPKLLKGCLRHEAGPIPPRAGNVSMNISKIESLLPKGTIQPWPLNSQLIPNNRNWHYAGREVDKVGDETFKLYAHGEKSDAHHPAQWHTLKNH